MIIIVLAESVKSAPVPHPGQPATSTLKRWRLRPAAWQGRTDRPQPADAHAEVRARGGHFQEKASRHQTTPAGSKRRPHESATARSGLSSANQTLPRRLTLSVVVVVESGQLGPTAKQRPLLDHPGNQMEGPSYQGPHQSAPRSKLQPSAISMRLDRSRCPLEKGQGAAQDHTDGQDYHPADYYSDDRLVRGEV